MRVRAISRTPWLFLASLGFSWPPARENAKESQGAARKSQGRPWLFLAFGSGVRNSFIRVRVARNGPRYRRIPALPPEVKTQTVARACANMIPIHLSKEQAACRAARGSRKPIRLVRTIREQCQAGISAKTCGVAPDFRLRFRCEGETALRMSTLLVQQYLNELADLKRVSGDRRESVVREAFKSLLKGWGRTRDLVFVPEIRIHDARQGPPLRRWRAIARIARSVRLLGGERRKGRSQRRDRIQVPARLA